MRGFTLLELLVVLVIVGILLGAARLSLTPDTPRQLRQQAARLQTWMQAQCDAGALQQAMTAFAAKGDTLEAFLQRGKKSGWKKVGDPPFSLPDSMHLRVLQAERLAPLAARGWRCWPEGEWTPGRVRLQAASGEAVSLSWDGFGRFQVQDVP